ncbi:hypothetical protein ACTFIR_005206 [Dictyostelium discoideum]
MVRSKYSSGGGGSSCSYNDNDSGSDDDRHFISKSSMKSTINVQQPQKFQDLYCNSNTWSASNYGGKVVNATKVQEKQLLSITEHPNSKEVKIKLPLKDWLEYLKENSNKESSIPYSIERSSYIANVEDFNVSFKCNFEIHVFPEPNSKDNKNNNSSSNNCDQVQIPLLPSTVCITSSSIQFSGKNDDESCVGIYQDAHSLFCDRVGTYNVELNVLANFLTPKKNGVGIALPKATFNHLEISVPRKVNVDVVEPLVRDNVDHLKYKQVEIGGKQYTHTIKKCPFQPTNYLKIQWTDAENKNEQQQQQQQQKINQIDLSSSTGSTEKGKAAAASQIKPIEATKLNVEQNTLCSVGEGVIMILSNIVYTVVSGSVSSFDILVGSNIKVLSVDGYNIKRWDCLSPNLIEISTPEPNKDQLIKVQLTSSVESSFSLTISAEIEMDSTSGTINISKGIRCSGIEISREKGYLAVESTANVEVESLTRDNLTLIDKSELPLELVSMSSGPLLLSYKFLVPKYALSFKVIKHQDLPVLVAFCPSAHFTATCSSEGAMLTKCLFTIRNEQQQYIRVTIPHQFEIWSTIVSKKAVKPAIDDQGCLMIPLNKSSGTSSGVQKTFKVELVYKHTRDFEFLNAGTFGVVFPQIDIPISTLSISLYLPTDYKYGEFTGNAKEIFRFSNDQTNDADDNDFEGLGAPNSYSSNVMPQQAFIPQQQQQRQSYISNVAQPQLSSFDTNEDSSSQMMGLKPIKVNIPTTGQHFKLEQLLVISTEIKLQVPYKMKKSCC